MRELKFRAWDDKNKKWLLGYELPNLGGFSLFGEAVLFGEWGSTFDKFLFERDGLTWDDLKVMQYTGLKDKNGKEIYEGDICQRREAKNSKVLSRCKIIYSGDRFSIEWTTKSLFNNSLINHIDELEIIGNIYDNPELLS